MPKVGKRTHSDAVMVVMHERPECSEEEKVADLNEARKERKSAEHEMQALQNRIALLKKEEERARARIQQTKKRAEEILRMRTENLERKKAMQKARERQMVVGTDPVAIKQRFVQKEMAKAARRKYMKDVLEKKRSEAQSFRSEKKKYETDLTRQRQMVQEEARQKRESVKRQREAAMKKIQRLKERQRFQTRLEYERKVENEKSAAQKCEMKVQELEEMESELIARLQRTQVVQRQAYVELEAALTNNKEK